MRHVTIKDIAKALSLSTSTVSRAMVDDNNIRKETKERILKAAREMGYRPNPVAKNLKAGHSNTVGVIVPEMVTPFASSVIEGIQSVFYPEGTKVIIADSGENWHKELDNMKMMESFMVDGMIIGMVDYRRNLDEIATLRAKGMPMVFYDRIPHGLDVTRVTVDDYNKSFFLVERLIRQGCRKIAHIKGPENIYNSVERCRGYRDAIRKFGLPDGENLIVGGGTQYADGVAAAEVINSSLPDCDAVFAFTDIVAIGAMNRFRELGKRIPEDIAVASFSGTELSKMVYPPLTTVEPPLHQMGVTAAQLLTDIVRNHDNSPRCVVLDAEIVMRESTDRIKNISIGSGVS